MDEEDGDEDRGDDDEGEEENEVGEAERCKQVVKHRCHRPEKYLLSNTIFKNTLFPKCYQVFMFSLKVQHAYIYTFIDVGM